VGKARVKSDAETVRAGFRPAAADAQSTADYWVVQVPPTQDSSQLAAGSQRNLHVPAAHESLHVAPARHSKVQFPPAQLLLQFEPFSHLKSQLPPGHENEQVAPERQ
jgi:hypothetical protein